MVGKQAQQQSWRVGREGGNEMQQGACPLQSASTTIGPKRALSCLSAPVGATQPHVRLTRTGWWRLAVALSPERQVLRSPRCCSM